MNVSTLGRLVNSPSDTFLWKGIVDTVM